MNIVVVGAGAVGGYFGAKLARAGAPVIFLVREARHRQIKDRGLRVKSVHGDFTLNPRLVTHTEEIASVDVVLVAVKNYHLSEAMPALERLVAKGGKILPLLNGVQHIGILVDALGRDNVLAGACYVEPTLNQDGDVVQTSPMQDIVFGPMGRCDAAFLENLESWLHRADIRVRTSPRIMTDMWTKYLFLVTLSGITAAARLPVGSVMSDPVTEAFLRQMITEAFSVAKAYEPDLDDNIPSAIFTRLASVSPRMTSSMHRDLEKGLPLELESLQGALIEMGRERGVAVPHFEAVYALLHPWRDGCPTGR
ncbi:MAG: ketopantoate reductase family protein [Firmicutes bacterium]|nr:ketopantoate reductase family protein [Bacillota bacterium]